MKKEVRINIRLNKDERDKFHQICKKEKTTVSKKIRKYILNLINYA